MANEPAVTTAESWKEPPLREILAAFVRRRWLFAWVVIVTTGLATLVGMAWPEKYEATALVMVEPREQRMLEFDQVVETWSAGNHSIDLLTAVMQTQISVIKSHELVGGVLDRYGMLDEHRLRAQAAERSRLNELLAQGWESLASTVQPWLARVGFAQVAVTPNVASVPPPTQILRAEAIDQAKQRMKVEHLPRSHVISVSYKTADPDEATRIANGLAEAYIAQLRADRVDKTQRARSHLLQRAEALQEELRQAELQVRDYRERTGLAGGPQGLELDQQRLLDLTTSLIEARGDRAALEARLQQIESLSSLPNAIDRLSEALGSPIVDRLREDRLDLLREYTLLAREFGDRHPRIIEIRSQQEGIEDRIGFEVQNALNNLRSEVASARARESAMQQAIDEAKGETAVADLASVELAQLMRQADASRALYEAYLLRAGEVAEQETMIEADARVIEMATTPTRPSSPPTVLFTIAGLVVSFAAGSVMVFVREQTDRLLRTADEIESSMQLTTIGMVPRHPGFGRNRWSEQDVSAQSRSAFAEAVRGICAQLRFYDRPLALSAAPEPQPDDAPPPAGGRVLMLASALPNEGKSTLAIALALFGAPLLGRTLLIDGDLRRPVIAERLGLRRSGARVTQGRGLDWKNVVSHAGVDVLSDLGAGGNPAAILAGEEMQQFMAAARHRYDFIVVDAPPVLGLPDSQILAQQVDIVLLVGRWAHSRIASTRAAAKRLRQVNAPGLAAAITDINMKKHAGYCYEDEAHYYKVYKRYYND